VLTVACGTPTTEISGVVERVIDGDTLDIEFGESLVRVRLIGIDTPEFGRDGEPATYWAHEATGALGQMLPVGARVQVIRDVVARDHCDRLLAYLFTATDNLFVNEELVTRGHAQVLEIKSNTAYLSEMRAASAFARRSNVGLWRACETSRGYIQR